jgi:cob(I)alamin adenosyltransferase
MSIVLSKIYTRGGDRGFTSLLDGTRIAKSDSQLECYGLLDELNSQIGLVRSLVMQKSDFSDDVSHFLLRIQHNIFDMGSVLAYPLAKQADACKKLPSTLTSSLESEIDRMNQHLAPLTSFILPGSSPLNAHCHMVRSFCRTIERTIHRLYPNPEPIGGILIYINRLSDYFFVLSRYISFLAREDEVLWQSGLS